jgi:glycosyltransferase involved in cell wall biosynthesis
MAPKESHERAQPVHPGSRARGRGIYLRWGANRNRADDIAERLGLELVSLRWQTRNPVVVPFRHVVQLTQTVALLVRRRPAVVFSHHTQPFCSLAAVLYASVAGAECVTDCHNGPFVDRIWQLPLIRAVNRMVFRRATVNLVHNDGILEYVTRELGLPGAFLVLRDVVPDVSATRQELAHRRSVVVISSFYADEPIAEVFGAARLRPDIHFYVTGNPKRLPSDLCRMTPPNVELTGFLPDEAYDALLVSADVALALSTRTNVLTRACHEAIGAETPLVTSDSPAARQYLAAGTVFVRNEAQDIARGIDEAFGARADLRAGMRALRPIREREWWEQACALASRLSPGAIRCAPGSVTPE